MPTRRNNVVGMFTTGLLLPPEGLDKYEEDPQKGCVGSVLLSRSGAGPDWWSGDAADPHDALMEIRVPRGTPLHAMPRHQDVAVVPTVLPVHLVRSVLVRDDRARRDFVARHYENFDPRQVDVRIDPDSFVTKVPAYGKVRSWIEGTHRSSLAVDRALPPARKLAAALFMTECPVIPDESLNDIRAAIVARLAQMDDSSAEPREIVQNALNLDSWRSKDALAEQMLLRHSVNAMIRLESSEPFGPRRLLQEIRTNIESSGSSDPAVTRNLRRVSAILNNDAGLRPLSPDSGLRTAKSLLLFLLRPAVHDVLTWVDDMPSDPLSVLGAALFAGLATDIRAIPSRFRRDESWRRVQDLMSRRINGEIHRPTGLEIGANEVTGKSDVETASTQPSERKRNDEATRT